MFFYSSLLFSLPDDQRDALQAVRNLVGHIHSLIQQNYTRSTHPESWKKEEHKRSGNTVTLQHGAGNGTWVRRLARNIFSDTHSYTSLQRGGRRETRPVTVSPSTGAQRRRGLLDEGHALLIITVSFVLLLFLSRLARLCAVARHLQEQHRSVSTNWHSATGRHHPVFLSFQFVLEKRLSLV